MMRDRLDVNSTYHGADLVLYALAVLLEDLLRHVLNDLLLVSELGHTAHQRYHDLGSRVHTLGQ